MARDTAAPVASTAQTRFVRAALLVYAGAAAVTLVLLVGSIVQDHGHDVAQAKDHFLVENEVRAQYLGHDFDRLAAELRRLALRPEVDLTDQDPLPERRLLDLAHGRSSQFNVGVAILSADGRVVSAGPENFLAAGRPFGDTPWFAALRRGEGQIVPGDDGAHPAVWLVEPVERLGRFAGAVLGAVDITASAALDPRGATENEALTVVATRAGTVVAPPRRRALLEDAGLQHVRRSVGERPLVGHATVEGRRHIVVAAPVAESGLVLITAQPEERLFAEATRRLWTRLAVALLLTLLPSLLLVRLFVRSLATFRSEEELRERDERLRQLGTAANVIAHEIKNLLNGLRMGMDMLLQGAARSQGSARVGEELRKQIERMADFTHELLIFSKGVAPRPIPLDLQGLVDSVAELSGPAATESGIAIAVHAEAPALAVAADPSLLRIVLTNLLGNAFDALTGRGAPDRPRIDIDIGRADRQAFVQVSDNGPGIAESVRPLLFEPFVSSKPSGVGLGLALSRKIARAHGGDLVLAPRPLGASFVLTLPLEQP